MPQQEFILVKCFNDAGSCGTFQVTQKRKDNTWTCKVCNKKQSIVKTYAVSYKAADIRPLAQKYNMERGQKIENAPPKRPISQVSEEDEELQNVFEDFSSKNSEAPPNQQEDQRPTKKSKWSVYLDEEEIRQQEEEDEEPEEGYVTTMPEKRKRGQGRGNGRGSKGKGRGTSQSNMNEEYEDVFDEDSISSQIQQFKSKKNQSLDVDSDSQKWKTKKSQSMIQSLDRSTSSNSLNQILHSRLNERPFTISVRTPQNTSSSFPPHLELLEKSDEENQQQVQNTSSTKQTSVPKLQSLPTSNISVSHPNQQKDFQGTKPSQVNSKWAKYLDDDEQGDQHESEEDQYTTSLDNYQAVNEEETI